jgi:hypothetical protein
MFNTSHLFTAFSIMLQTVEGWASKLGGLSKQCVDLAILHKVLLEGSMAHFTSSCTSIGQPFSAKGITEHGYTQFTWFWPLPKREYI